jgi:hypothetical protein
MRRILFETKSFNHTLLPRRLNVEKKGDRENRSRECNERQYILGRQKYFPALKVLMRYSLVPLVEVSLKVGKASGSGKYKG